MKPAEGVHGRHQVRRHRAVLRASAEVHSRAAVGHDLRRVQARLLEVGDEALAHEVALARGEDRHVGVDEALQHLEVVADVVAVVVREEDEHGLRILALHVLDEAFLGGVLRRLRDAEPAPARVVPDPCIRVGDLLVIRRGELDDAAAQPANGDAPAGHARAFRAGAHRRAGRASAERQRAAECHHAAQDGAPLEIDRRGLVGCTIRDVRFLHCFLLVGSWTGRYI
jgi:hypothetical protein